MFSRVQDLLLARSVRGSSGPGGRVDGGRTTDRQHLNFTGKGRDSQVGGLGLWINKFMYFYELQFHGEKILFSNLFSLPMKSDLPFGRNWGLQHLAKCGENGVEFRVVRFS